MDGLTYYKFLNILKRRYIGASLNRVLVSGDQLSFSFFHSGKSFNLLYKTTPPPSLEFSSVVTGEAHGALANLSGAVLENIRYRDFDRIGSFVFTKRKPSGKLIKYTFVLEPTGNYANAFLLNEDNKIMFSLSSRNIDPDRDIGAGKIYQEPKPNKKYTLINYDTNNFNELTGFYPATVKLAETYLADYTFEETCKLISHDLLNGDKFFRNEKGKVMPFAPFGETATVEIEEVSFSGMKHDENPELKNSLIKFFSKKQKMYKQLLEKLYIDKTLAAKWYETQSEAELVSANLHVIKKRGNYELDLYSENGVLNVKYIYDSELQPSYYAAKLFKKASKLKRSLPLIEQRIEEVIQMIDFAEEQLFFIDTSTSADLKELASVLKPKTIKPDKKREEDVFHVFDIGDAKLYIGKNSAGNHKLVFNFAIASDLWFHAQKIPSAHGILRKEGEATQKEIESAASIVAKFSKNKNEQKVPVDYTKRKYVKKPKNTPAGFVIYDKFKTVLVKPAS